MKEDQPTNFEKTLKTNAAQKNGFGRILFLSLALLLASSCEQRKELLDQEEYGGPLSSLDSINTLLSDSARIVMHMKAARQNNYENADREWPEGLYLESFDKDGNVTSIFTSNYAYYDAEENLYRAEGNVVVRSNESGDELKTEELFWDPTEEKFYTDKFVTIVTEGEVHTGEGLNAKQDFTSYRILKPRGTFTLEDDPTAPDEPKDIPLSNAPKTLPDETF